MSTPARIALSCMGSGLLTPDTHLGENARYREVSDDQATSYLYPLSSSAKLPAWWSIKATVMPKRPVRSPWWSRPCAGGLISFSRSAAASRRPAKR